MTLIRTSTMMSATLMLVLSGPMLASPSLADDQAAPLDALIGTKTSTVGVDGAANDGVSMRAGRQCLFDFKAYYNADRASALSPTREIGKGEVVKASGNCKATIAKTTAFLTITHTAPPGGNIKQKSSKNTSSTAPFFAATEVRQDVPSGRDPRSPDYYGVGTQITFEFKWRVSAKNGNYVEFCRNVTGLVKATSVSKNGDTGIKPCGSGQWK